ncbi:ArpU family phage packaging/lysis transcriptional regulator [uncultured Vagococcus sp.]|uniref:ArpU family phage packaging/lysis transcriptional regulator n=1 Tax=uncultured Vagococcus sp. TaxID=189676 RepID=UPI0028D5F3F5|nr:ArpU family phage packaging/lysis transcriptional regulator [uncultured Vagococcus sp.]
MALFDITQYEVPKPDKIDMDKTKYNVGIFLSQYKAARSRAGETLEPKTTSSFSLVPPSFSNQFHSSVEETVILNDEAKRECLRLHAIFNIGYASIVHPFKTDVTERRRRVFILRFLQGLPVEVVCQRITYEKDVVREESNEALVQFANALELVVFK